MVFEIETSTVNNTKAVPPPNLFKDIGEALGQWAIKGEEKLRGESDIQYQFGFEAFIDQLKSCTSKAEKLSRTFGSFMELGETNCSSKSTKGRVLGNYSRFFYL